MKPTLIAEGKVRKVSSISFYDGTQPTVMVEGEEGYQLKNVQSIGELIWEGRYTPAIDTLNAHLEESEQYLQELKMKIANEVIVNKDVPFPTQTNLLSDLVKEHEEHKSYIEGLVASIELLKELAGEDNA